METPCIEWTAARTRHGHGLKNVVVNGKATTTTAHRWTWQEANGPIPDGLVVRHKCDNPPCVNLDHLELGTVAANNRDRKRAGTDSNQNKGKTACSNGHPFDDDNTYWHRGKRACRECRRVYRRAYKKMQRAKARGE